MAFPGLTAPRCPRGMLGLWWHLQTLLLHVKECPRSVLPRWWPRASPVKPVPELVREGSAAAAGGAAHLQFTAWKLPVGGKLNNE